MSYITGDRKDTGGKWLTLALFWEYRHDRYTPSFTTKEDDYEVDGVKYLSLRKLYMEYSDPKEYLFAKEVIGSWDHWQAICNSYKLRSHIQEWREELEVKLSAEALKAMIISAKTDGSKGVAAAKYIAERGWMKRAGRPSKEEVERERKIAAGITSEIEEDAKRIGIH